MAKIHSVRMLIGAHAYAAIQHDVSCQTDIRLSPGKSAQASLREYARELRADIANKQALADLACAAADHLDREKQVSDLRQRRAARGDSDPLARLRHHVDSAIAAGSEPVVNKES